MPLITRAIIDARFAPRVGRQMRLDLRKLRFRQPKLVATHLCLLFGSRESRHYVRANTFMGPDARAELPRTPQSHFFSQFFNWFSRRLYLQPQVTANISREMARLYFSNA